MSSDEFMKINLQRMQLAINWFSKVSFKDLSTISTAAMVGGIGKIIANRKISSLKNKDEFKELLKIDRIFAENEIIDTTSEEITANILRHWGFNSILVDSIFYSQNLVDAPNDIKHLAIANYVIYHTFDKSSQIDEDIVNLMADFLKEMNFDKNLYLNAIKR